MRRQAILITGASGDVGRALVARLAETGSDVLVTLDLLPLELATARFVSRAFTGSVTDYGLLERILAEFAINRVFHLASVPSATAEFAPIGAHDVNVRGTLSLLEFSERQAESHGDSIVFLFPSSIAVYGLPAQKIKLDLPAVKEDEWNEPRTMYGCNKLYCELLGKYYRCHYKQLNADTSERRVDFRCLRIPGLIGAETVPAGGASDYLPEMIHAVIAGRRYNCVVRPDTQIPFMVMPDAVDALLRLSFAPGGQLTRTAYNVASFALSADDARMTLLENVACGDVGYAVEPRRQAIVDSWPSTVDDSAARRDWGFCPALNDFRTALLEYLIPVLGGSVK